MYWACEDMARFLSRDPENVVAIHCKVGGAAVLLAPHRRAQRCCHKMLTMGRSSHSPASHTWRHSAALQAGKGRSGLIICMLLLRIGMFTDAKQAIAFYNQVCIGVCSAAPPLLC